MLYFVIERVSCRITKRTLQSIENERPEHVRVRSSPEFTLCKISKFALLSFQTRTPYGYVGPKAELDLPDCLPRRLLQARNQG